MKTKRTQSIHLTTHPTLVQQFREQVALKLDLEAQDKGYNQPGLFELTHDLSHPLAEIIYKVVRYHHQHDPADLEKIAAWAELEWVHWHSQKV